MKEEPAAIPKMILGSDKLYRKWSSKEEFGTQSNDYARVEYLLKKGTSANSEDSAGYTALHYGARNGHCKLCKLLLENGANVNALTRSGQATPLHRSATQGHVEITDLLLKSGADSNIADADGYTALHRAVISNSGPVCKLLISKTDPKSLDNCGRTPSDLAKERDNKEVLEVFKSVKI
ncbi:ankyrin repeat domain-containing protein 39-like isoform X2 [Belonocnema kinseyi]|uniref:ankyrin repeat domain-containing protein 39-like isoform X2 n=1 Tax=Belonocnema kinseyi TaxID=2817044 RepID=UPI00143D4C86|nr:ankyrin repeat domain-containing protein 39-like isoform X2 [Belonocnema kinseyi]